MRRIAPSSSSRAVTGSLIRRPARRGRVALCFAGALLALVVLVLPAAVGAKPKSKYSRLLDTIFVPPTPPQGDDYRPSRIKLEEGERYRVVVEGEVEYRDTLKPYGEITTRADPLYCFFGTPPFTCDTSTWDGYAYLLLKFPEIDPEAQGDLGQPLHKFAGVPLPPYAESHRYEAVFRAHQRSLDDRNERRGDAAGKKLPLLAQCNCNPGSAGSGFLVDIFGAETRPNACPEMRTDDGEPAGAQRRCEWAVPFTVKQSGIQTRPSLPPESDLISTTTVGQGEIYFSDKPDPKPREPDKGAVKSFELRQVDEYLRPTGVIDVVESVFVFNRGFRPALREDKGTELVITPFLTSSSDVSCRPGIGLVRLRDGSTDELALDQYSCNLRRTFVEGPAENQAVRIEIKGPREL